MAMALCSLGAEATGEYRGLLNQCIEASDLDTMKQTYEEHTKRSEALAESVGVADKAQAACELADQNFRSMRDDFMDDMPKDLTHVLSWIALSSGGGIAIWGALEGLADAMGNSRLADLSNEALKFQKSTLERAQKLLYNEAKKLAPAKG
ncbi:MAG TPA: hypothetical protein VI322_00305 [Candidatus Saccharimonadia bacterium]